MPKHGSAGNSLRPRKPESSLGRTAQDGHLDSHTAPELRAAVACVKVVSSLGRTDVVTHGYLTLDCDIGGRDWVWADNHNLDNYGVSRCNIGI